MFKYQQTLVYSLPNYISRHFQKEFSEKIGISMRTIQKMENDPNFRTSKRMAYKVADEIVNNPAPQNSETLNLLISWNKET